MMKNDTMTIDEEAARQHALALANRVTLAIAMIVWIGMILSNFVTGTGWRVMAGLVPMIPLIWHGTYLYIKRSRREAAARIVANLLRPQTGRRHSAGKNPDSSDSSISLLLP
jgi:hypothetical protein